MSGNLCRCGAYAGIVAAVRAAASDAGRMTMRAFDYLPVTRVDDAVAGAGRPARAASPAART